MHEESLARALLRDVIALAASRPGMAVREVRVSVGEFSGVDAELFREAFARVSHGSPLEGAGLTVERVPLAAACPACGREFLVQRFRFVCPACGGRKVQVVRGEELRLVSVTVAEVAEVAEVSP
jgi:hydrogenase nickel incorporation protein HypA/HybF